MEENIITKKEMGKIAQSVLEFMEKKGIGCLSDLEGIINQTFLIDGGAEEFISIEIRPSKFGEAAYAINYIDPRKGIPLEIRINKMLDYSIIIVKGNFVLPGYSSFSQDVYNNIIQDKHWESADILYLKSELKNLKGIFE